jgi:5-methyltetrahydropteroyltriglutamate--homocysteine methyltransferase
MKRIKPPFRADHVGSLLRPAALKEARAKYDAGEIDVADLRAVEDREVAAAIAKQEQVGLTGVTDGEFRRAWWHFDFFDGLEGVDVVQTGQGIQFQGTQTKAEGLSFTGPIDFPDTHPFLDHFRFLESQSDAVAKFTIPSPSVLHFRQTAAAIAKVYPDLDRFFDDTATAYAKAIDAFHKVGCRYLQLDDTVWAYLCSEDQLAQARDRGFDTDRLADDYARTLQKALAAKPDDMTITMHACRGNFRSTWISEGGYEPVAERLFNDVPIDGYFLEFDTERAGGFEPLRFVPKGDKQVVLGLITSKTGALEDPDAIRRRIDDATRHVALDQLCLSPQCGFASTEEGNLLTEEEQWAKLKAVVDIAAEVWD